MTGDIHVVANMTFMEDLQLANNSFSGTIRDDFFHPVTETIDISTNRFHGSIPTSCFANTKALRRLYLADNQFTGSIPIIFHEPKSFHNRISRNDTDIIQLTELDIDNNLFSGYISPELFQLPKLKTLSLSVNCLDTDLSDDICNTTVQNLLMNGVGRNSKCPEHIKRKKGVWDDYVSLPKCIWSIQSLQKLYLTGNGYTGKMENFFLPNISELSIGSNGFRGLVPNSLDGHELNIFDLSSNEFTGILGIKIVPPQDNTTSYAQGDRIFSQVNACSSTT